MARKRYGLNMMEVLSLIAMVVIPELSTASTDVRPEQLRGAHRRLQQAINTYAAEHDGVWPDGRVVEQLTFATNRRGTVGPSDQAGPVWPCGPYLERIPSNPYVNFRLAGRIKIAPAERGGGNAGWYYDPSSGAVWPDVAAGGR
jgi:hypothetical protein